MPPDPLVFVAHDPGAKNHLGPLHRHAVQRGYPARFIDLAGGSDEWNGAAAIGAMLTAERVAVVVAGCSTNGAEWEWIRAARATGTPSAMMIDIGIGTCLDDVDPTDAPDTFLVTNERCVRELQEKGYRADSVHVTGNPYLESLASLSKVARCPAAVARAYGTDPARPIISMFLPPEGLPDGVLAGVHVLVQRSSLASAVLVVRPHPRTTVEQLRRAADACAALPHVVWDGDRRVDTTSLLGGSICSLTLGSTVSAESWALGVPSAFYQIGWDYHGLDELYRNLEGIPRLRTADACHRFLADAASGRRSAEAPPIERIAGATASGWRVIYDLLKLERVRTP